jgi:hypothetical protein
MADSKSLDASNTNVEMIENDSQKVGVDHASHTIAVEGRALKERTTAKAWICVFVSTSMISITLILWSDLVSQLLSLSFGLPFW